MNIDVWEHAYYLDYGANRKSYIDNFMELIDYQKVNQKYQEITSCSNCTNFQAQAVNCRVRRKDGSVEFVHTLNGTAIPLARALVVILENYAEAGGKLKLPEVLQPYFSGKTEI